MTRFLKNPDVKKLSGKYDKIFEEYGCQGIIEKIDNLPSPRKPFYLPRIVFDGSTETKDSVSINDCLYSGPCLYPLIFDHVKY